MTPQAWIAILGGICTVLVTVTTWGFLTGRFAGTESQKSAQLAHEVEHFKTHCDRRFDEANEACSKAMSYVQGMESRFMREFAPRDLTEERFIESRRDRELIRVEMVALKAEMIEHRRTVNRREQDR